MNIFSALFWKKLAAMMTNFNLAENQFEQTSHWNIGGVVQTTNHNRI